MARSKSSTQWLKEHFNDPYVKRAQQEGWRSRAAYKLLEIQKKRPILKQGMTVVDLGAAPGGWTQVAASLIGGGSSQIIALDILPMDPYGNATVIQGDFTDAAVHEQLLKVLGGKKVDLVLCDMAPNMSGNKSSDQLKMMYLLELAYDFAKKVLSSKGYLLMKAFYGEGFDVFLRELKIDCAEVKILKPDASRSRSAECYVLVQGVNASEKRV